MEAKDIQMRMITKILNFFMAAVLTTSTCFAMPAACQNPVYRRAYPNRCTDQSTNKTSHTALWLGGGAAAAGIVAIVAMAGGGSGGGNDTTSGVISDIPSSPNMPGTSGPSMPTMNAYDRVGYTNPELLAAARANNKYAPNVTQYDTIRAAYSLARGYTGKNSTIAILDSGDYGYHGTAVKNIAGGAIAPDVHINAYKIVNNTGDFIPYDNIASIIASDKSANIFNASWGTESQTRLNAATIKTQAQMTALTSASFINEMINAAQNRDAIFVWAAGNEGRAQSTALAAMPRVVQELEGHFINVVAWDNATGALADYSNACGVTKDYCITAPGTDMNVEFGIASGTSFAAPVVSAAIAVIRQAFPYMNASEITQLLFTTARDLGAAGVDEVYGWGMLDLERATRPVGAPLVAIDDNMMQPVHSARASGVIGRQLRSADLKFAFFDSFGRAFDASLNETIDFRPMGRAWDRMHDNSNDMTFGMGSFQFGFTNNSMLVSDGFLKTGGRDLMTFVGMRDEFDIGGISITARARAGFTSPRAADDSLITEFSNIISLGGNLDAKWGDWRLGIGIPDTIVSGDMNVRLATGRAADGRIQYRNTRVSLGERRPATEYTIEYKFMTAGYINNPGDTDEFYIMAKTSIQF